MKITLTKPLKYKDVELEVLELDLESLTGQDILDLEDELRASGQTIPMNSQSYFLALAAKALHIPSPVIKGLPLKDFMKVTNAVLFFLNDTFQPSSPETSEG